MMRSQGIANLQLQKRTYVDFDKPDESDEESADKAGWSRNRSGTDSDDIENQKRSCRT